MSDTKLIRRIHMECPVCDEVHEVEERYRVSTVIIKGEETDYEERYYYCPNADEDENEFESGTMLNQNLMNARNAYRVRHNLLTSDEIVAIRENYGLSQVDLANLLGWGEATISRYESKAIQDEAYDTMLRLIKNNPLQALEFLKKNADKFSPSKHRAIKERIVEKLDSYGKEYLSRQALTGHYVYYDEPSDSNGYALLDIDKLEAVISYFAQNVNNLFKVKLMKMLWYADALNFKRNGRAITGLVYIHESMGALPIGHYSLMNLENLNVQEEESCYGSAMHVYPSDNADYAVLSADEKAALDAVVEKFKQYNAAEIIEYMHDEEAYIETEKGRIIPFSLAEKIKPF